MSEWQPARCLCCKKPEVLDDYQYCEECFYEKEDERKQTYFKGENNEDES